MTWIDGFTKVSPGKQTCVSFQERPVRGLDEVPRKEHSPSVIIAYGNKVAGCHGERR